MGSLSVQTNQAISPVPQSKPTTQAEIPAEAAKPAAGLSKDSLEWKSIPSSERIKTAITTTFKKTIIPYTIGGALAAPVAGAALGGFIGLFAGTPGKGALEGAKAMVRFMPHGAAVGAGIAGIDAAVVGTVVGSSPDRQSAMLRLGSITAIAGLLTAEDEWDILATGIDTAHSSYRAGVVFDRAAEALNAK